MQKVQVVAELSDAHFHAYEKEAERRGVTVVELVQHTVNCLLRDLEQEEDEGGGPDYLISAS